MILDGSYFFFIILMLDNTSVFDYNVHKKRKYLLKYIIYKNIPKNHPSVFSPEAKYLLFKIQLKFIKLFSSIFSTFFNITQVYTFKFWLSKIA